MKGLYSFNKSEKLCHDVDIEALWKEGRRSTVYPFRIVCREREEGYGIKVLIIARKKQFRHAVDRNRWKRVVREAYRLQKHILDGQNMDICFMVLGTDMPEWKKVYGKMNEALTRVLERLEPLEVLDNLKSLESNKK